jgi:hypothetical protein
MMKQILFAAMLIAFMNRATQAEDKPFCETIDCSQSFTVSSGMFNLAAEGPIASIETDGTVLFDWKAIEKRVAKCRPMCSETWDAVAQMLLAAKTGNWKPLP